MSLTQDLLAKNTVQLDSKIPAGSMSEKWDNYKSDMKLVNPNNKRKFKVIVVGSGLAGASAAATLAELERPNQERTWLQSAFLLLISLGIFAMTGFFNNDPLRLVLLIGAEFILIGWDLYRSSR